MFRLIRCRGLVMRIACLVCVAHGSTLSAQAVLPFLDDFSDGDLQDGFPGTWAAPQNAVVLAESGNLIMRGTSAFSAYVEELGGLRDVSIQTQFRFLPSDQGLRAVVLFARSNAGAYWSELTSDGLLAFGLTQPNGQVVVWGTRSTSLDPIQGDVRLQFDVQGDQLALWAWSPEDLPPARPQLSRTDDAVDQGGRLGLRFLPNAGGAPRETNVEYRYVFVHDATANEADLLALAIRQGSQDHVFDWDHDGQLTWDDRIYWVEHVARTWSGDANLDGQFGSSDLIQVLSAGQYEDGISGNSSWRSGDWDGDGEFDTADLLVAFQDGGYERGPRAVPEPWYVASSLWALIAILLAKRPVQRDHQQAKESGQKSEVANSAPSIRRS